MEKNEEVKAPENCSDGKKCRCGRWKKIVGIVLAVIVVLVIAAVLFLDFLVVKTVRTVGPEITGTPVELKDVSIGIFTGRVELNGLALGNPEGYSHPNAFELEKLVLHVDLGTVLSKKIVVREITVKGMAVDFEANLKGSSNLIDIKNNVDKKLNSGKETAKPAEKKQEAAPKEEKEAPKVVIGLIDVSDVKVRFGSAVAIPIMGIRMENVGERTPMEVINEFFAQLLKNISVEAANKGLKNVGDAAGKALNDVGSSANKALNDALSKSNAELEKAGEKVNKEINRALKKINLF